MKWFAEARSSKGGKVQAAWPWLYHVMEDDITGKGTRTEWNGHRGHRGHTESQKAREWAGSGIVPSEHLLSEELTGIS